jgi:hypothetical protein
MKNINKVLGIIAFTAIIVFAFLGCKNPTDSSDTQAITITNTDDFATYLNDIPANTANTPVSVKIDIDLETGWETLNNFIASAGKYVEIDLSDSTGITTISNINFPLDYHIVSIALPNSVIAIEDQAFYGHSGLTSVTIPKSVATIGDLAFAHCTQLVSINIPDGITSIGTYTFQSCAFSTVSIPKSVVNIGDSPFLSCKNLNSIDVDATNPSYTSEDGILFSKDKITLIQFPAGKNGGNYTIPSSVNTINMMTFYDCALLTSITIPSTVTNIDWYVFAYCTTLISINVDATNPSYTSEDGILFDKDKITLIQFPAGKNVADYTIPNDVKYISAGAFGGAKISSVTIPSSVTYIDENAFIVDSLVSVTFASAGISLSSNQPFRGDLPDKYLTGGAGTYTTQSPGFNSVWEKE